MDNNKKLLRPKNGRKISGVCLAVANYFGMDVSIVRILVIGFMFGNLFSILYSLAGAFLSLTTMTLLKKHTDFSLLGISVAGGVTHNIGQLIIAMMIVESASLLTYAPALLISGIITGLLIGIVTTEVNKRIY